MVPSFSSEGAISGSLTSFPCVNSTIFDFPSRMDSVIKKEDKAFTALDPTPFNPTVFLNTFESYLAPVLILETQSFTFPNGIPLP